MSNITDDDHVFRERLYGLFTQLFHVAGVTLSPKHQDRFQQIASTIADSIQHQSEKKSVEVIKVLQTAVKAAFEAMEKDMTQLREQNAELNERLKKLEAQHLVMK